MLRTGSVVLRAEASLDYEAVRSYSLTIVAEDSGFPALSNTTTLVINVLDVNDNVPVITTTQTLYNIPEVCKVLICGKESLCAHVDSTCAKEHFSLL